MTFKTYQHPNNMQETEMESSSSNNKVIILYPSPGIGHLVSMVELGKLIHTHHPSLSVIILITPTTPNETTAGSATSKYINTVPASITVHHLPAIVIPPDVSSDHLNRSFGIPELYKPLVHNTLLAISEKSTIKAVILDFFTNAAFQVSKTDLNLPTYYFFTSGASGLCGFLYLPTIHKLLTTHNFHSKRSSSGGINDLDIILDIPGVPPMHLSYMPQVMIDTESNSFKYFLKTAGNMANSNGIIVNSFLELEERAVETLRDGKCVTDGPTPPVYTIGPLIAHNEDENEYCLKWLKTQPCKSVVFLCFGSMGVFKKQQLNEIAVGLERSGQRFLWVVRDPPESDHVDDGKEESGGSGLIDDILPEGFLTRTRDKGLVVKNWAPQLAILGHESVGGFVSHCGWNSSLEAVVTGVPMVAWPLYAEQKMNRVYLVEEIKVALWLKMSADGFVSADAVEETVRQLMEGEEGRAVRERILEMSRRAKAAVEERGSSRVDLMKLTRSWTDL